MADTFAHCSPPRYLIAEVECGSMKGEKGKLFEGNIFYIKINEEQAEKRSRGGYSMTFRLHNT